jgi:hypothetical protein
MVPFAFAFHMRLQRFAIGKFLSFLLFLAICQPGTLATCS